MNTSACIPLKSIRLFRAVSEPRAVATGSSSQLPMKRDYIDFQDRSSPIGYLITFRCYGTWLHGDERGCECVNSRGLRLIIPAASYSPTQTNRDQRSAVGGQTSKRRIVLEFELSD